MALNIPISADQIFNRIAIDIVNELNDLDPFLRNSLIRAISVGMANAFFELYKTLQQLEKLAFWDTTEGESLVRWAAIFGITKTPATISSGFITLTGVDTSPVPINTQFTANTGGTYQTTSAGTITATNLSVTSMTRAGQIVSVITSINHGLASNMDITISGAVETDYNGTFPINVTGLNTFEYTITGSPTTPATGTIIAAATYANIPAQSLEFGASQNLQSGSSISLSSPVLGVNNTGYVSFDEMSGGADVETDDSLRNRFLFRLQNPIALFNENAIIDKSKTVSGVTRVWVQTVDTFTDSISASTLTRNGDFAIFETATAHGLFDGQTVSISGAAEGEYNIPTAKILVINSTKFGYVVGGSPPSPDGGSAVANFSIADLGQVRVFFVRDNDAVIIPTPSEVTAVLNSLLEIKPAPMSSSDLIVSAPTAVTVPFTFSSLIPNTVSMQTAITNNLNAFFSSNTNVGSDLQKIDYESVINSTLDSGGNPVQSFALTTPTTDISISGNELPVLGTITY